MKLHHKTLACLLFSISLTCQAQRSEPPLPQESLYEIQGFDHLQKKDYSRAIQLFDSAISKNRNAYKAYVNKASALTHQKKYAEAISILDQVIALKPNYLIALYDRAYVYNLSGDPDQALPDCNTVLAMDSRNAEALLLRAGIKDKSGDPAGSEADCNLVLSIDSTNAEAYNQRALTRFGTNQYAEIIADCNRAIALKPDYYDPYIQRGDAFDDMGEYDKAIADYNKAITIDPGKMIAYRECAASVAHKNDLKSSLVYLNKGLQIEPGNTYLLEHKYRIQRQTGDIPGAISTLNLCIKHATDSPALYLIEKVWLYDSLHDVRSACQFAFDALKGGLADGADYITSHPCTTLKKNPLVLAQPFVIQAQQEGQQGMFNASIASFSKAIALLPDSPVLYFNRGLAKRKSNNFSGAIADYDKAISLRPTFTDAISARAAAKAYLKDAEGAKKDLQLAIRVDPKNAIANNNYAAMIADTDIPGAIGYLTKAIQYRKGYMGAYLLRAKLYQKSGDKEKACADFKKAADLGSDEARIECRVNCK